jgi:hypothetical protein
MKIAWILRTGTMRVLNCSVMNLRRIVDKLSNLSNPGITESLLEFSNSVPNVTKAKHYLIHQFRINWQVYSISTADYILTQVGYKLGAIQLSNIGAIWCSILSQVLSSRHFKLALYTASPWTRGICKVNFEESRVTIVPTHYSSLAFLKSRPSQRKDSPL